MSGKLNMSLEAQFHRQIKSLKWCGRRMQGEVMGAFRAVVPSYDVKPPEDVACVFELNAKLERERKRADELDSYAGQAAGRISAIARDNDALKQQINSQCEQIAKLTAQLYHAQQGAKQSRRRSLLETCTSTSLGFVGSLCITWGSVAAISNVATASLVATLGCTVWSLARGYSVRRFFEARR